MSRNFQDRVGYGPDESFGWALFVGLAIVAAICSGAW